MSTAAGALVRHGGAFHRVADPLRHPLDGVLSLGNLVGSPVDKARVGLLRAKTLTRSVDATLAAPETSTLQRLQACAHGCAVQGYWDAINKRTVRKCHKTVESEVCLVDLAEPGEAV